MSSWDLVWALASAWFFVVDQQLAWSLRCESWSSDDVVYPPRAPGCWLVTNEGLALDYSRSPKNGSCHPGGDEPASASWGPGVYTSKFFSCELVWWVDRDLLGLAHLRVGWHLATFTCSMYHRPGRCENPWCSWLVFCGFFFGGTPKRPGSPKPIS